MGSTQNLRVEVETSPAVWQPGTAGARTDDGMIAVRLDGEARTDLWSPDRVRPAAEVAL